MFLQEVCVTGTAAARAEAVKVGSEEDDDADFIRTKNRNACQKRDRKAEMRTQKDVARAAGATAKQPSQKKKKKSKSTVSKVPKAIPISSKVRNDDREPEEKDVESGGSDHDDSDSDAADEDEELAMNPSHYRTQQGYSFEDESGEGSDFEELNVIFDHFNPKESDFGGIRQFLSNLLCGAPYNVGELVDVIIGQSGAVGTVVKVAGEEEVYGVTSVISFAHYASFECIKQITKFILSKCPADQHPLLEKMLRSSEHGHTGFIVNERMVNMPNEMALPLMKGLFDEIGWSQQDQVRNMLPMKAHNTLPHTLATVFLKIGGRKKTFENGTGWITSWC
jgi:hypothetical protein